MCRSHARKADTRPPGFSILLARHVARKRNLLGAFTKLCVRTTHYIPGARNKMPHVSRFLSFVHCGRPSVFRIPSTLRKSVIPSRIGRSSRLRVCLSAHRNFIAVFFLLLPPPLLPSSPPCFFLRFFFSILLCSFFIIIIFLRTLNIDGNVVNVTRLLPAIS